MNTIHIDGVCNIQLRLDEVLKLLERHPWRFSVAARGCGVSIFNTQGASQQSVRVNYPTFNAIEEISNGVNKRGVKITCFDKSGQVNYYKLKDEMRLSLKGLSARQRHILVSIYNGG